MPVGRWLVFDTTVYVAAIRGGVFGPIFRTLEDKLPRTYLVSVVAAELRAGATTEAARRTAHELLQRFCRVGRVTTPGPSSWERAGDVLGRLCRDEPHLRSKVPLLWNDLLIALSAREIGATVVTENLEGFELLRGYVRFDLRPFA